MYKITKDLANAILKKATKAVGYVGPYEWVNSSADYFIYEDSKVKTGKEVAFIPSAEGFWLCRKEELTPLSEPLLVQRMKIDIFCNDPDALIDITECCTAGLPVIDRLTCKQVQSLDRLLELEPRLKTTFKR